MNKRMRSIPFLKRLLLLLLLLLLLCGQLMAGSLTVQAVEEGPEIPEASEQSEATEFPVPSDLPDTLTVKTGFSNTGLDEYQEEKSFPLSELETLDLYLADYTFLNEEGRLYVVRAQGFLLTDLLKEVEIEIENVSFLHFLSSTPEGERTVSFSKEELLDTTRLCNYSLVNYYEEETGTLAEHRRWMAAETDVMIALQDSWILASEGGSFEDDGEEFLIPRNRFRLIFGQTDCLERDAERAVGAIHTILVQFSGEEPEVTGTDTALPGEEVDTGQPEEGSVDEEAENRKDRRNEEDLNGTEETGPDPLEAEPSVSVQSPEENPVAALSSVTVSAGKTAGNASESPEKTMGYEAESATDHPVEQKLAKLLTDPSMPESMPVFAGEIGGSPEMIPVSITSGSSGQAAADKLQTGGLTKDAAEENSEEGRTDEPAGLRATVEDSAETEMQRLIPVTIRNTDGNGSFNPLLRPAGWMTVVIFLLGCLAEYIHYHKEMGGFRFIERCRKLSETGVK